MMQELRNFSKAFLIFVVVAFVGSIIFAWGMDIGGSSAAKGYIAKVNGEEIEPQTYENVINNFTSQINQNGRVHLDWAANVQIRQEAWDQMVRDIVLNQHINKLGLKVSEQELFQYLWNYPPRSLWNNDAFMTNGQFDMSKYRQFLGDPQYASQVAYIEQLEEPQILRYQWNELMRSTIQITPEEMMQEFRRTSEKIKVDYAYISTSKLNDPPIVLDSAEILAYYNENKENYRRDPQAELEYVQFDIFPTAIDSSDDSDLRIWIQHVKDSEVDIFPTIAATISDDSRARQTGGDIGWISRGKYTPEFDSVAFALDSGQIAPDPIKTPAGWHVIKCYGRRTTEEGVEEVSLKQIMKKIRPSAETFSQVQAQATTFKTELEKSDLATVATKYNKEIHSTGLFFKGNAVARLGVSQEANDFAFKADKGAVSDIIMVANIQANTYMLIIARLKERLPERVLDQNEAYNFAKNELLNKKLLERAGDIAQKIYEETRLTLDMKEACIKNNAEFIQSDFLSRADTRTTRLASDPQFMAAVFSLNGENMISKPVFVKSGAAVVMFTGMVFNPAEYDIKRQSIYNTLWAQKVNTTMQNWTDQLMEKAEIEDYRRLDYKWMY